MATTDPATADPVGAATAGIFPTATVLPTAIHPATAAIHSATIHSRMGTAVPGSTGHSAIHPAGSCLSVSLAEPVRAHPLRASALCRLWPAATGDSPCRDNALG